MSEENKKQEENEEEGGPWGTIIFGVAALGIAYYFYTTMTSYENGEGVTMNSILLIAYEALGKNITTGILGLLGVGGLGMGIKELLSKD